MRDRLSNSEQIVETQTLDRSTIGGLGAVYSEGGAFGVVMAR
jgi:hypothetical protein